MTTSNHEVARALFAAISNGEVPDDLLTPDMTVWTTSSGHAGGKERFQGGIKMLAAITNGGLQYHVDSLTSEDDRVAAEIQGRGTLINGETFHMHYFYMLRIRDGRVAAIAEHTNPLIVNEKIAPLMREFLSKK